MADQLAIPGKKPPRLRWDFVERMGEYRGNLNARSNRLASDRQRLFRFITQTSEIPPLLFDPIFTKIPSAVNPVHQRGSLIGVEIAR